MTYRDDRDALRDRADQLETELEGANERLETARAKLAEQEEKDVDDERRVAELEAEVDALRKKMDLPPREGAAPKPKLPWMAWIPVLFCIGLMVAGVQALRSASEAQDALKSLGGASSKIDSGALVGLEGTLDADDETTSPVLQKSCSAAHTELFIVTTQTKRDAQGRDYEQNGFESFHVMRAGPAEIPIKTATGSVAVPLERWSPSPFAEWVQYERVDPRKPPLSVGAAKVDEAEKKYDSFSHFAAKETCLPKGQPLFVAGKLEAASKPDGLLRVAPHPELGRVELFAGTRQQLIDRAGSKAEGNRLLGMVLFGVGAGLFLILLLIWFKFIR